MTMKLLTLDEVIEQWEHDAVPNKIDPDMDLLDNPRLHSKYASQVVLHKRERDKKQIEYSELLKIKTDYYSGRMNNKKELDTRNWEPFSYTIKGKDDLFTYLSADSELNAIKTKINDHNNTIDMCEMIVKAINNRSFEINGYLGFAKYKVGS
jgi:hypothetical protein